MLRGLEKAQAQVHYIDIDISSKITYSLCSLLSARLTAFSMSSFGCLFKTLFSIPKLNLLSSEGVKGASFLFFPLGSIGPISFARFSLGSPAWNLPKDAVDTFANEMAFPN